MIDIRLTLPPQDASDFIQAYLEKLKGQYPNFTFTQTGSYSHEINGDNSREQLSYNEGAQELSVHLNTW